MAIQHIDMAVPVGSVVGDNKQTERAEGDLANLEAIQARLNTLIANTCGLDWRADRRAARQREFDVEIRSLIKKFASTQTLAIKDRNDRTSVRTELYTDLLALVQAVRADVSVRQSRFVRRARRLLTGMAGLVLTMALALAALTLV